MIKAPKDKDPMGRGLLCTCPKQYLLESTWNVHRHKYDIGVGKMSVSVMTTTSPDEEFRVVQDVLVLWFSFEDDVPECIDLEQW